MDVIGEITRAIWRSLVSTMVAILLVLTVGPLATGVDAFNTVYNSGIKTIEPNGFFLVRGVRAMDDAGLSFNVTVLYGPNVDLLVLDKDNFESYKNNGQFSYSSLSQLNASTAFVASNVGELVTGTEYYLVIDNTGRPSGGASPSAGNVQVVYDFGAVNVQIVDSGFSLLILVIAVVAVVAIIAVLVILFLLLRKKKQPNQVGVQQTFQDRRVCPRCGLNVSVEHQFCPNCGNRLW